MNTKEFIKEQFEDILPEGWVVERVTKMETYDNYDYTIRLYNTNLEHQTDVFINVTEKGFVQNLTRLKTILKESTKHICEQFTAAL